MTSRRHILPLQIQWLIAALLFMTLAFTAQLPSAERFADDSFSVVLVESEGGPDDTRTGDGRTLDGRLDVESSLDALTVSTHLAAANLKSTFSTTRYLAASYLASFINAPPRAPPARSI